MKTQILIAFLLVLLSCKNEVKKESKETPLRVDSTEAKFASIYDQMESIESELEFETISQTLESTFKFGKPELKPVYKPLVANYYSLIDSNKVINFKSYLTFLIIEFDSPLNSKKEFAKIKAIAQESLNDKSVFKEYGGIFSKGGISFNQIDKWIIAHYLRCNMLAKDYETDKKFTTELEKLNFELDWLRSYCGWAKMEIK
ncbi:MAG: hypothetical protein QNJ57_09915 [Flavobacteriaceae bacterium]|nr:hypothetical protein [Flavobacteriaceae bacterium]